MTGWTGCPGQLPTGSTDSFAGRRRLPSQGGGSCRRVGRLVKPAVAKPTGGCLSRHGLSRVFAALVEIPRWVRTPSNYSMFPQKSPASRRGHNLHYGEPSIDRRPRDGSVSMFSSPPVTAMVPLLGTSAGPWSVPVRGSPMEGAGSEDRIYRPGSIAFTLR